MYHTTPPWDVCLSVKVAKTRDFSWIARAANMPNLARTYRNENRYGALSGLDWLLARASRTRNSKNLISYAN